MFLKLFLIYILIMSIISMASMYLDKQKAIRHAYRIPEKTLFLFVLLGGGIGGTLGMHLFHHKTKHWYFALGFPFITLLEAGLFCFVYFHFFNKGAI